KAVITSESVTQSGLFKIHKVGERYYFEMPDSLMNREILVVNRIIKSAANIRSKDGFYGYSGDQIGQSIVQFVRSSGNRIFLKQISFQERALDSSVNGLYGAVR